MSGRTTFDDPLTRPRAGALHLALAVVMLLAMAAAAPLLRIAFDPAGVVIGKGLWQAAERDEGDLDFRTTPVPVAPVEYLNVTQDNARRINASIPFSTAPNPSAGPLRLALAQADQARATDCLGAAAWYEAGDDPVGEQAVIQVVINRMRHPAFPKTICGVVFQGWQRSTGCQFSFTCDGSIRRRTPPGAAWSRARALATAALGGLVFAPVGHATHYHTDWVVPNWSRNVDKITEIHTHLFFRWRGANGRPGAFTGRHPGSEPTLPPMAPLSPAHAGGDAAVIDPAAQPGNAGPAGGDAVAPPPLGATPGAAQMRGNRLAQSDVGQGMHVVTIAPGSATGALAVVALDLCRGVARGCTVAGYLGAPGRLSSDALGRTRWDRRPDFYYFADRSRGRETVYWDCRTLPRRNTAQCMPADFTPEG